MALKQCGECPGLKYTRGICLPGTPSCSSAMKQVEDDQGLPPEEIESKKTPSKGTIGLERFRKFFKI
jgi:hypothetical protein